MLKRALGIWALKNSLRKNECFFAFCVYKKISQKKSFCISILLTINDCHQQKTMCTFYIYKKQTNCKTLIYIYKKPDNLQKAREFALRFIHKNPDTSLYAIFHEFFEIGIYINTKSMTLCVRWRFIQKAIHFEKARQFALRFLYTKILTFCVT